MRIRSRGLALPLIVVLVPFVLSLIYYSFFAIGRYESSTSLVVRQTGAGPSPQAAGLAMLLAGGSSSSHEDTLYLSEYIRSPDMLRVLESKLNWSKHYSARHSDPLYWLADDAPEEDRLKFYRRVVEAYFDQTTGLLQIKVQAFSPEFANEVLKLILTQGEALINELSHRMGRDQVIFAQTELALARKNFEAQREKLLQFQSKNKILDAEATVTSRTQILATLEAQLAEERALLLALNSSLNSSSPQIQQKRVRIGALERQISSEKAQAVAGKDEGMLNVVAADYKSLALDAGIAEEVYKLAVGAVESARIEASKKIRSLMVIVSPNMPDDPSYPRLIYNLITILLFLLLFYGIIRFVLATVEDHRD